ncbi:hypothetical protein MKEN_01090000 [Mycena kentingensis (nom. inval.)]|nr:hypothetical protein MKEN_01090000 [Mycena kentingensis (nom. inval.)]
MLPHIPFEIWRAVALFIPEQVLATLYTVNKVFLAVCRERRYTVVNVDAYKSAKPLLNYIKASPLVHTVHVRPWLVRAKDFRPPSALKLLYSCISPQDDETVEAQIVRRVRKQTRRLCDSIRHLPNVHTYHIDWDEGPVQAEFISALLDAVLPSIGPNLHTLVLKIPFRHMLSLPSLAQYLPQLQTLSLTIHTGSHNAFEISERMEGVIVFLNCLLRHLSSLALFTTPTSTFLDLGVLFAHLGHGRRLKSFALCIPFDGGHLPEPHSLRRFLAQHSQTLDTLKLETTRAAVRPNLAATSNYLWIRDSLRNRSTFASLTHVSLALRPLRTDLTPLFTFLSGLRLLQQLRLSERPLEFIEIVRLLEALENAAALRALSMRVRWLSPELVDALAATLPQITVLHLDFPEVIHSEPSSSVTSTLSNESRGTNRANELALFCAAFQGVVYRDWQLSQIAVPENQSTREPIPWLDDLERVFVECVPGLTRFEELLSPI